MLPCPDSWVLCQVLLVGGGEIPGASSWLSSSVECLYCTPPLTESDRHLVLVRLLLVPWPAMSPLLSYPTCHPSRFIFAFPFKAQHKHLLSEGFLVSQNRSGQSSPYFPSPPFLWCDWGNPMIYRPHQECARRALVITLGQSR